MQKKSNQLSLADVFEECQRFFDEDKPKFLSLLESAVDISCFIPQTFYDAFYLRFGRNRKYPLEGFVSALILQKILTIQSDALLINFLVLSKELRKFCGFDKVPDASKFTRFKQSFVQQIQNIFDSLVEYTEPICRKINAEFADILIYDTSGVEAYVNENNPKYANTLIKRLKTYYKSNPKVDPYKMAYGLMPSHARADDTVKQMYINGCFCYARKVGVLTNGLGIIRHISFFDDDFKKQHPEIIVEKKSDSPDEDKTMGDSTSLQPVLNDFFSLHPDFHYDTFLGDSAFDKADHYSFLKDTCNFSKVLIPINQRNSSSLPPVGYNEYGYPVCPNDDTLVMKRCGVTCGKNRTLRIKWICPKAKGSACSCENPCSTAKFGRTAYTYGSLDFRMFPGISRDGDEWIELYKKRCIVERSINHFKTNMCVADRKTRNSITTKADLLFAGIAQLLTIVVADFIKMPALCRSLKPLIA